MDPKEWESMLGVKDGEEELAEPKHNNRLQSRKIIEEALAGASAASGTGPSPQGTQARGRDQSASGLTRSYMAPMENLLGQNQPNGPTFGGPLDTPLGESVRNRGAGSDRRFENLSGGQEGKLSPVSIAHHASRAGWKGDDLVKAVAIAMAESGGVINATGDKDLTTGGELSRGLWQINYRPGRDEGNAIRDPQRNSNPATNAQNAHEIYKQQGWRAWSVAHGDANSNPNHYSRHLDAARAAVNSLGGG